MVRRILTIALTALCAASGHTANMLGEANFARYEKENAALPPLRKGEQRVVFIGNSITEGWIKAHPDFFKDNGYINRGISGQTSSQMLLRFRHDVIDIGATAVVIGIGANDIAGNSGAYNEDFTFANILSMVDMARANGIKVILASLCPCNKFWWAPNTLGVSQSIQHLNKRLKAYAVSNAIPWADYYSPLVHPADGALPVTFSDDGVHPNSMGYSIMEPIVQNLIYKIP